MSQNVIQIRDLNFAFNSQSVLQDIDLDVKAGDFIAMIGPNGGGKTTLLKLMLGLFTPDSGSIRVFAEKPQAVSYRDQVSQKRNRPP